MAKKKKLLPLKLTLFLSDHVKPRTNPTLNTDAKHATLLNNKQFLLAVTQYRRRTSGAVPRHGLPEASMQAAELHISLAKNISMLAEDLETNK